LEGEERIHFASMLPDAVLEEAGMDKKEIKQIRTAVAKSYDSMLAETLAGLQSKSDEELHKRGLADKEITTLHDAYERVEKGGTKAIHELKTSSTNDHGIERLLTNWAVPSIKADKA